MGSMLIEHSSLPHSLLELLLGSKLVCLGIIFGFSTAFFDAMEAPEM